MTTMTVTRLNGRLCALLIVYIGASCAVQLEESAGGLVRWSGLSVLVPVTAAALLPLRRSLIIGIVTLAASIATYGFAIRGVSAGGRTAVIAAVALSFVFSLVICRARPYLPYVPATATPDRPTLPRPANRQADNVPDTPRAVPVPPPGIVPAALPQPAVVELAGHYRTGCDHLGMRAHWLDAIPLSGARVGLVVGTVTGPGADATAAELRAAVRTLADIDLQPEELLTHLNDVLARLRPDIGTLRQGNDTQTTVSAECLYAVYDPITCHCTLAGTEGPPPAVVTPDGAVTTVDLPESPPLGQTDLPFEATGVDLPEGSRLLLYTHSATADELDSQKLTSALAQPEPSLDATCRSALDALLPAPEAAVLAVRTHALDTHTVAAWDLPADPAAVSHARTHITEKLAAWGLTDAAPTTELIVSELVTNAIRHAEPPIQLRLIHHAGSLVCEVADGSSTSPHLRRACTFDENGRGLFIIAQLAERWGTRHNHHGKTIWAEHTATPDEPATTA
ncbi:ATP-binding SpoIIE family protein phosphatase [Streptomyces sp900116325]|uniref:ATP-binding SpoIIE family protein phosphatase n=1 Tax=Streptomyces sp. 900116325 TaxID=3154295 RepID=UPI0033B493FF